MGTYEPSVFVFPDEVIHASRAARPGLAAEPDCRLMHRDCFSAQAPVPHLRLVTD